MKNPVSQDTLKLTITDKDTSDPLVASVTIGEETKDSGIDGVVQFTLAYGDYEATIECEGYTTATEELAFRSNHKNFTVELEAAGPSTGTVTVTCVDSEQTLLPGIMVLLATSDDPGLEDMVAMATAGQDGSCTLETLDGEGVPTGEIAEVPFDTYYLLAQGTGYSYSGTLTVDGDEEVTITLIE